MEDKKMLAAEVPPDIYRQFKESCEAQGQTMSAIIKRLVFEFIKEQNKT